MAETDAEFLQKVSRTSHALVIVTAIALGLRLCSRFILLRRLALDDYAIILAYLCCAGQLLLTIVLERIVESTLKGHLIDLNLIITLFQAWTGSYVFAMMFLKISLGIFFLRIFSVHLPQRLVIYGMLFSSIVMSGLSLWVTFGTCLIRGLILQTECPSEGIFQSFTEAWGWTNSVIDLGYTAVAVYALSTATMGRTTRIAGISLICCGTAGGIVSFARIIYIVQTKSYNAFNVPATVLKVEWTILETGLCITTACLAFTRPLFALLWTRLCSWLGRETADSNARPEGGAAGGLGIRYALTEAETRQFEVRPPVGKKDGVLVRTHIVVV